VRRMTARKATGAQHDDLEAVGIADAAGPRSVGHEPARDVPRHSPRELERVPLASSEEPFLAEHRRCHVDHAHASSLADHPW